ncbi:MAG: hypothetical protein NXY57DRAFT_1037654 [Lentinula lateritia]|nr:MAG: hypothetical protein NXY57DRAFT_1037654 [Lentinula lateritia]
MRHDAIDPCLGFYPSVSAHVAANATATAVPRTTPGVYTNTSYDLTPSQNRKRKTEEELPRIDATPTGQLDATKPEPATVIPENRLNPESNKRRDVKRPRKYAKQRQKQPKNDVDTGSEQETPLSPPPIKGRFEHDPMRIHSPANKTDVHSRVKRKRRRPLANCLLQAAVLSGVNPVDSLIEPDSSAPPPTRKPLQFEIPDFLRHTPESQLKRRPSWTLVDPHRTTSIRTVSFASVREKQTLAPSSLNPTLKPLTGWSTSTFSRPSKEKKNEAASKHARIRASSSKVNTKVRYGSRRPLMLVPIEKSELLENKITRRVSSLPKESLNLTSHVIGTGIATKTSPPPLTLINVLIKEDTSVIKSTNQASSPSHMPQASHLDLASEIDNIGFNTNPDPELKPNSAAVAPLACVSIPPSPKLIEELQVSPLLQNLPALILNPTLPSVPSLASLTSAFNTLGEVQHYSFNEFLSPISSTSTKFHSVSTPSRPDTISADSSKKPAKPLSSFFDEFLETVRVATSASQHHQKVNVLPSIRRERLGSSRKGEQRIDLSNAPQPHVSAGIQAQSHPRDEAGDYIFDEWALRTTSKVESEHVELKNDSQEIHNSPLMTTRDLLAVLQPSQFQITLHSLSPTPVSQTNSIRSSMSGLRAFYM